MHYYYCYYDVVGVGASAAGLFSRAAAHFPMQLISPVRPVFSAAAAQDSATMRISY